MGYIPSDPREADGYCVNTAGIAPTPTTGFAQPYMTGGAGAGTIVAAQRSSYPWPVTTMSPSFVAADMTKVPQYTRTGSVLTMPTPSFSAASGDATSLNGNGWYKADDTQAAFAAMAT
jgi:glucan 1,3-beta-glucosidase